MNTGDFESAIVQKGRLLPGIHGLRGIAALAVVLFHLNHLARLDVPTGFTFIGRDFGYSVHLFFIVSAFSLMHSTEPRIHQPRWLYEYMIKRFFRIAPLFYFIIFFELGRQLVFGGLIFDMHRILLNLTFTFNFVPFSELVWAGWTVGVEMIFYVLFPVLVVLIRTHRAALVFLVLSVVVSYTVRFELHIQYLDMNPRPRWDWSYFAFASNLCFFGMGLYAYRVSHLISQGSVLARWIIPSVAILVIGSLMFFGLDKTLYDGGRLDIVTWGVGLAALCIWQSLSPSYVVANKFFEFLGERSFSIYLVHPIVLTFVKGPLAAIYKDLSVYIGAYAFFVCAALSIPIILLFAEFTYRLIEVPGINLGRRLITRMRQG